MITQNRESDLLVKERSDDSVAYSVSDMKESVEVRKESVAYCENILTDYSHFRPVTGIMFLNNNSIIIVVSKDCCI